MVITEPNKFVREVHDRMPVLLRADQFAAWLVGSPQGDAGARGGGHVAAVAGVAAGQLEQGAEGGCGADY